MERVDMMKLTLDDEGQPPPAVNAQLRMRRDLDEMLGLCKGIILDGVVLETEATALAQWLERHPDVQDVFPADVVARRLSRIFADGEVTEEERLELHRVLQQVLGTDPMAATEASWSSHVAFDKPAPAIVYPGRRFCFTGKFYYGTRKACERAVSDRGGEPCASMRKDLHYLVIGLLGSRDWVHSTHGTKIMDAIGYRGRGLPLAIVSEQHWTRSLA
jgi:hypothetical protein